MNKDQSVFDDLSSKRTKMVESMKENGALEGLLIFVTKLYPDSAHFIYELLQNAEDAGATILRFALHDQHLIFSHNGHRLFSIEDVEAITNIGNSTKKTDRTTVGEHGVGFKAVYEYTHSPEIHSGNYHFQIHDMWVPERIAPLHPLNREFATVFRFPFDRLEKPAEQAVKEITLALQKLDHTALLFLNNIREINFVLVDGTSGSIERSTFTAGPNSQGPAECIKIRIEQTDLEAKQTFWLRYSEQVSVLDKGLENQHQVALAFGLEEVVTDKAPGRWKIVDQKPGRVFIFFPTEKETSNLKFHIHAPFESTVARDSVPSTKANKKLLKGLAELLPEVAEDLRDNGLLTVEALSVFPLEDDDLSELYEPIRLNLIKAFKTRDLVPTKSGEHRPASDLFKGLSELSNVIDDSDLSFITRGTAPLWCANAAQNNQRADRFLSSLQVSPLDGPKLWQILTSDWQRPYPIEITNLWLATKSDTWLQRFYAYFNSSLAPHDRKTAATRIQNSGLQIVRVDSDDGPKMAAPKECFFKPEETESGDLPSDIRFVRDETYKSGRSDAQKNDARSFLENCGIKNYDEEAKILQILDSYSEGLQTPDAKTHLSHVRQYIRFYKNYPEKVTIFSNLLLFGQDLCNSNVYCFNLSSLYLDAPYENTGLNCMYGWDQGGYPLWDGYSRIPNQKLFIEFIKTVGIKYKLLIKIVPCSNNIKRNYLMEDYLKPRTRWTDNTISRDYIIEGIDYIIEHPSLESSKLIWNAITSAHPDVARAEFRLNNNYELRTAESQIIYKLRRHAWVPDRSGVFHKPKAMTQAQLPEDFVYDDKNGLLAAIGFGQDELTASADFKAKDKITTEMGLGRAADVEALVAVMKRNGLSISQVNEILQTFGNKPTPPSDTVANPERRSKGVAAARDSAPDKTSVVRERKIQPGLEKNVLEAKAYLRAKYTNRDGVMVCQACDFAMPFKTNSGDYYFEAVQIIKNQRKELRQNRLALCPTCAAKYQYARATDDNEIKVAIKNSNPEGQDLGEGLSVVLADESVIIKFVASHQFDLKIALEEPS